MSAYDPTRTFCSPKFDVGNRAGSDIENDAWRWQNGYTGAMTEIAVAGNLENRLGVG
jgi:hypothetical protein